MFVVDVTREVNALREARSLGIPTICLIDSDGDPDMADIAIPGNDDSMRSIDVIVREIAEAIKEGKTARVASAEGDDEAPAATSTRRRSSRSQFRADDSAASESAGDEGAAMSAAPVGSTAPAGSE
jgi:small subunit ribosomal protein S2